MDLASASLVPLADSESPLLAASASSRLFATIEGGHVLIADFDGHRRHRLDAHMGNGKLLAFSPDGLRLLTASGDSNHRFLCLWELGSGRCLSKRPIPDRTGRVLWTADESQVLIARFADRPLLAPLDPKGRARSVQGGYFADAVRSQSGLCAFAMNGQVMVTTPTFEEIASYPTEQWARCLSFTAGDRLAYLDDQRLLLRLHTEAKPKVLLKSEKITATAPAPDGKALAVSLGDRVERISV